VDFGARRFLADVGFGGHNLLVPVPFELGREHRDAGAISRIERDDESFVLRVEEHGELKDYYSFGLERQHPVDFEMANWFCSTAPSSKFVTTKIVSSVSTAQRATLVDRRLRIVRGAEVEERRLDADDAFLGVLREVFGIELPEGRALRWPASA
jgi:N-hydroxyarylamine O-acetyltransferase